MNDEELVRTLRSAVPSPPPGGGPRLQDMRAEVRRRRRVVVASAAAVVVLLGGVGVVSAVVRPSGPADVVAAPGARLECPAELPAAVGDDGQEDWVPSQAGFDGASSQLAPEVAVGGVVCGYSADADWGAAEIEPLVPALQGARILAAPEVAAVAGQLALLPGMPGDAERMCTAMGGPSYPYLLGLRDEEGRATWIRMSIDPNSCSGASNGEFESSAYLGKWAEGLLGGTPTGLDPEDPCHRGTGRLRQGEELVPGEPTALTVCVGPGGQERTVDATAYLPQLLELLRGTSVIDHASGCAGPEDGRAMGESYLLRFAYAQGPDAWVEVSYDCRPGVQAAGSRAELPLGIVGLLDQAVR